MPVLAERELLPYLDLAYQGFGDGIVEDAYALRALAAARGRDGRPLVVLRRQLVLEEHEPVRRALRRAQRRLRRRGARRRTSSASSSSRCAATTRARRSTAARSSPRCSTEPALRATWEAELAAMRERIQAMRQALHGVLAAKVPGRDFGYFLQPARHVQLHRPDRRAGRPPARGVRGLPGALGADVRRRAEHAATSRRPRVAMAAVLAG